MREPASVIAEHLYEPRRYQYLRDCSCGWRSTAGHGAKTLDYAGHLAEAIAESRTIHTVEQLEALTPGLEAHGTLVKEALIGDVFEKQADGSWERLGDSEVVESHELFLPALLLWSPEGGER